MSYQVKMERCLSCNKPIFPKDHGTVRFDCPNCEVILIIRCSGCRTAGNKWQCPNCSFRGP